jgi:hypothetical protein
MLDLYFLTRLGALHDISVFVIFAVCALLIIGALIYFANANSFEKKQTCWRCYDTAGCY